MSPQFFRAGWGFEDCDKGPQSDVPPGHPPSNLFLWPYEPVPCVVLSVGKAFSPSNCVLSSVLSPAMIMRAAWPMWHAPREWWPVCTGKWRNPSPSTLRTPTVMMTSLLLPTCLQWRLPTQWYKVSPLHPTTPHQYSPPDPESSQAQKCELPSPRGLSETYNFIQLAILVKCLQQTNSTRAQPCRKWLNQIQKNGIYTELSRYLEMPTGLSKNISCHPHMLSPCPPTSPSP